MIHQSELKIVLEGLGAELSQKNQDRLEAWGNMLMSRGRNEINGPVWGQCNKCGFPHHPIEDPCPMYGMMPHLASWSED